MKKALSLLIALLMVASMLFGCAKKDISASYGEDNLTEAALRKTILYFATNDGYVVPVMRKIPWEEGIGKAALNCLVCTSENNEIISKKGLKAVIPEGVSFDLKINSQKNATVNIKNLPKLNNQSEERVLLQTIVNTLTEFPSIDSVSIQLDGKNVTKLSNGTQVGQYLTAYSLNIDDTQTVSQDGAEAITVYVPNKSCALYIPVSTKVSEKNFFCAATKAVELCKNEFLSEVIPKELSVISSEIKDGIATVVLSDDFLRIGSTSVGVDDAIYKALYLTASNIEEISSLRLFTGSGEGEEFIPSFGSLNAPVFANTFE